MVFYLCRQSWKQ